MVALYVRLIILGLKTIDDVPENLRAQVEEALQNEG
jgi:hypothetical protein